MVRRLKMSNIAIRTAQSKGQGVFAIADIPRGTRILAEDPLVIVSRTTNDKRKLGKDISNRLETCSVEERQAFFSLHNAFGEDSQELGIARTNALPLGDSAAKSAVFLTASRINHACDCNAQNTWNESIKKLTIHATRDIRDGEEVTIFYLDRFASHDIRKVLLKARFRFDCRCGLCSLSGEPRRISDRRLDEIQSLDDRIGDSHRMMSSPLSVLHDIRKLLTLLEQQGIAGASVARAYNDALQLATTHSDLARAKVFAERSSYARATAEGPDSPRVQRLKAFATGASRHSSYGMSELWATAPESSPEGLDAEQFDDWLWRAPHHAMSQLADLRDQEAFPAFSSLPMEHDIDLKFFVSPDGFSYHPRRHWCLLAEIVEVEHIFRVRLLAKDRAGHVIPIAFYTDGSGREVPSSQLRKGYTVAILYAEQHGFLDLSNGVRHEDAKFLKVSWLGPLETQAQAKSSQFAQIFPASLAKLLSISDRVKEHGARDGRHAACHSCGKTPESLKRCARCSLFWYCGKVRISALWKDFQ